MKKIVMIVGAYRDCTDEQQLQNILRAREAARILWSKGFAVICPHMNSMLMSGSDIEEQTFLEGYLDILTRCDYIWLLDGWEKSKGAVAEVDRAKSKHISVLNARYGNITYKF